MKVHRDLLLCAALLAAACGGREVTSYQIVAPGAALTAAAGDALRLDVQATYSDGTTGAVPAGAQVTWGGPAQVKILAPGSTPSQSALPEPTANQATVMWLDNPTRFSSTDLSGVLWVLAAANTASQIEVKATVTSAGKTSSQTALVTVQPGPKGDATRGKALHSANCASCHGATGHGQGDYPGINGEQGNPAAEWSAALFGISSRAGLDDEGVALSAPMPLWQTQKAQSGKLLTNQDLTDIYAFLKTQMK